MTGKSRILVTKDNIPQKSSRRGPPESEDSLFKINHNQTTGTLPIVYLCVRVYLRACVCMHVCVHACR